MGLAPAAIGWGRLTPVLVHYAHHPACTPPHLTSPPPAGNGRLGEALGLTALQAAREKEALLGSMPGLAAWLRAAKQAGTASGECAVRWEELNGWPDWPLATPSEAGTRALPVAPDCLPTASCAGRIETLAGRQRWLPHWRLPEHGAWHEWDLRGAAERAGINTIVQVTCRGRRARGVLAVGEPQPTRFTRRAARRAARCLLLACRALLLTWPSAPCWTCGRRCSPSRPAWCTW